MIYSLHGRFIHAFPCFCCLSSLPMPSIYLSNFNLGLSSCMLHHASRLGNCEKGVPFSLDDLAKLVQMEHCNRWGKHMLLNSGIIYCPTTRARIPEFMLHLTLGEGASTCLVCDKKRSSKNHLCDYKSIGLFKGKLLEYLKQQVLQLLPFLKDSYLAKLQA